MQHVAWRRLAPVLLCAVTLAAPSSYATNQPAPQAAVDALDDCDPLVPAAVGLPAATPVLPLRLLLLIDQVPLQRLRTISTQLVQAYGDIGIALTVTAAPAPRLAGTEATQIIDQLRGHPHDHDMRHLLTARDLTFNGEPTLVGYADCIGGIARPGRATSVSEVTEDLDGASLLYRYGKGGGDNAANVAIHEIGHLLGARHEHADCASGHQASIPESAESAGTPCTVMFLAAPTSGVIGPIEAAVMRGYAAHADLEDARAERSPT